MYVCKYVGTTIKNKNNYTIDSTCNKFRYAKKFTRHCSCSTKDRSSPAHPQPLSKLFHVAF